MVISAQGKGFLIVNLLTVCLFYWFTFAETTEYVFFLLTCLLNCAPAFLFTFRTDVHKMQDSPKISALESPA